MTYALVTNLNISYQPRENLKTFLENNLTHKIKIYSYFPDVKALNFPGFPFIVIPDAPLDASDDFMGTSNRREVSMLSGTIYHDKEKLGDDKVRVITQDILKLNSVANQKTLRGYGVDNISITFLESPETLSVVHNKALYEKGFTIEFNTEVAY